MRKQRNISCSKGIFYCQVFPGLAADSCRVWGLWQLGEVPKFQKDPWLENSEPPMPFFSFCVKFFRLLDCIDKYWPWLELPKHACQNKYLVCTFLMIWVSISIYQINFGLPHQYQCLQLFVFVVLQIIKYYIVSIQYTIQYDSYAYHFSLEYASIMIPLWKLRGRDAFNRPLRLFLWALTATWRRPSCRSKIFLVHWTKWSNNIT